MNETTVLNWAMNQPGMFALSQPEVINMVRERHDQVNLPREILLTIIHKSDLTISTRWVTEDDAKHDAEIIEASRSQPLSEFTDRFDPKRELFIVSIFNDDDNPKDSNVQIALFPWDKVLTMFDKCCVR